MGPFANRPWVNILAWSSAALIVSLNLRLVANLAGPWVQESAWRVWVAAPLALVLMGLLAWVTFAKPLPMRMESGISGTAVASDLRAPVYRRILVPLDHSTRDRAAIGHAAAMARLHGATIHVLHVEEDATSQLFGALASTAEVSSGLQYFEDIVQALERDGVKAELRVVPGRSPRAEIVRAARELQPDLVVMGAHGHTGIKDLIFGTTINGVRHAVNAPVLVVGEPPSAA
jgi:manganese transport protein